MRAEVGVSIVINLKHTYVIITFIRPLMTFSSSSISAFDYLQTVSRCQFSVWVAPSRIKPIKALTVAME